ncbi:hypothetical protein H0H87_006462 [Tephrocybe sp. NHM501043]|nr:hypothetical protein H0H87_006462 [Tephrocybe sp. NHM501043]
MANHQLHPLEVNSLTSEPFLRLRNHKNIILTPPRAEDSTVPLYCRYASHTSPILGRIDMISKEHANAWYEKVKTQSDESIAILEAAREVPGPIIVGSCPVRAIRELKDDGTDVYLGDIGIVKVFNGKLLAPPNEANDAEKIAQYLEINNALPLGDEAIVWSIGGTIHF